jgi:hypothetical protein
MPVNQDEDVTQSESKHMQIFVFWATLEVLANISEELPG